MGSQWRRWWRRYAAFLPVLLGIMAAAYLLVQWAGQAGRPAPRIRPLQTPIVLGGAPPAPGTPIARYAPLDARVIDALERAVSGYGAPPLEVLDGIPPIGAYLPRSGDTLRALPLPTATTTPLPFPTPPPLPIPTIAPPAPVLLPEGAPVATLPPVVIPTLEIASYYPTSLPNAAGQAVGDCAPRGLPVDGVLTQRMHAYHPGVDLGVPSGTAVIATHSGSVTFSGWSDVGYGYLVVIQGGSFITYYAHNTSLNVESGQRVARGAVIAFSGSTGNSSGPHVHYETRINDLPVDPLTFESRGYSTC